MAIQGDFLKVGELPAPPRGGFTAEPRQVQEWLGGLPMANPANAGKAIYEKLKEISGLRLLPKLRFQMLEALLEPLDQIMQYMARAYVGKPFPLNVKSRNAGMIVREFCRLMAQNYAQVAYDLGGFEGSVSLLHRGSNIAALQRSLWFMKKLQVNLYHLYSSYPRGFWLAMHALHAASVKSKRAGKALNSKQWPGLPSVSAQSLWQQSLILAASNPYRLRQQAVTALEQFLMQWNPLLEVVCGAAQQEEEGLYFFSPEVDAPPSRLKPAAQDSAICSMQVRALAEALPQQNSMEQAGNSREEFLDHLRQEWGVMQERGHQRMEGQHRLETLFGLSHIHYRMAGNMPFEKFVERSGIQHDADDASLGNWLGKSLLDQEEAVISEAQVLDQSLGGYRLRWSGDEVIRAQVGELVGLTLPGEEEDRDWVLGVIRWLNVGKEWVEAGVQLLSHRIVPAVIKYQGRGQNATFLRALMLNGGPFQTPQHTLIVPATVSDMPESLLLAWLPDEIDVLEQRVERVRPTQLVERNQSFVQLDYEMEAATPESDPAFSMPQDGTEEAASLWDDL